MTIITPELIEKAARAIDSVQLFSRVNDFLKPPKIEVCRYGGYREPEIVVLRSFSMDEDESDAFADMVREFRARAAIEAILPDIVEACAKYLVGLGTDSDEETQGNEMASWRLEDLAAGLRSLADKER